MYIKHKGKCLTPEHTHIHNPLNIENPFRERFNIQLTNPFTQSSGWKESVMSTMTCILYHNHIGTYS